MRVSKEEQRDGRGDEEGMVNGESERQKEDLSDEVWQHCQAWWRERSLVRKKRKILEVIKDRLRRRGKKANNKK